MEHVQDNNTDDHSSGADIACSSAAICPGVASTFVLILVVVIVGSSVVIMLILVLVLVLVMIPRFPNAFPLCHIRCDANPGTEPQDGVKTVDGSEGVDVAETSGPRPHWDTNEVDEAGNTKPALVELEQNNQ